MIDSVEKLMLCTHEYFDSISWNTFFPVTDALIGYSFIIFSFLLVFSFFIGYYKVILFSGVNFLLGFLSYFCLCFKRPRGPKGPESAARRAALALDFKRECKNVEKILGSRYDEYDVKNYTVVEKSPMWKKFKVLSFVLMCAGK